MGCCASPSLPCESAILVIRSFDCDSRDAGHHEDDADDPGFSPSLDSCMSPHYADDCVVI